MDVHLCTSHEKRPLLFHFSCSGFFFFFFPQSDSALSVLIEVVKRSSGFQRDFTHKYLESTQAVNYGRRPTKQMICYRLVLITEMDAEKGERGTEDSIYQHRFEEGQGN